MCVCVGGRVEVVEGVEDRDDELTLHVSHIDEVVQE